MIHASENPFSILRASTQDNRQKLQELLDAQCLSPDFEVFQAAHQDLTKPMRRLAAEINWFPGSSPEDSGRNQLSRLNLHRYAMADRDYSDTASLAADIHEIDQCFSGIDLEKVRMLINQDRSVAGFSQIENMLALENEFRKIRSDINQMLKQKLRALPEGEYTSLMDWLSKSYTSESEFSGGAVIDDIFDAYEGDILSDIDNEKKIIQDSCVRIKERAESSDLTKTVLDLVDDIRKWCIITRQLQRLARAKGTEQRDSLEVIACIRSTIIELNNKKGKAKEAFILNAALLKFFLPTSAQSVLWEKDRVALRSSLTSKGIDESAILDEMKRDLLSRMCRAIDSDRLQRTGQDTLEKQSETQKKMLGDADNAALKVNKTRDNANSEAYGHSENNPHRANEPNAKASDTRGSATSVAHEKHDNAGPTESETRDNVTPKASKTHDNATPNVNKTHDSANSEALGQTEKSTPKANEPDTKASETHGSTTLVAHGKPDNAGSTASETRDNATSVASESHDNATPKLVDSCYNNTPGVTEPCDNDTQCTYSVDVDNGRINVPGYCTCCMRPISIAAIIRDSAVKVSWSNPTADFLQCAECQEHAHLLKRSSRRLRGLAFIIGVVFYCCLIYTGVSRESLRFWIPLVIIVSHIVFMLAKDPPSIAQTHTSYYRSVWSKPRDKFGVLRFFFTNKRYAEVFAMANVSHIITHPRRHKEGDSVLFTMESPMLAIIVTVLFALLLPLGMDQFALPSLIKYRQSQIETTTASNPANSHLPSLPQQTASQEASPTTSIPQNSDLPSLLTDPQAVLTQWVIETFEPTTSNTASPTRNALIRTESKRLHGFVLKGVILKNGSKGEAAMALQQFINDLGESVEEDGIVGRKTMDALNHLQEKFGLQTTSKFDHDAFDALYNKLDTIDID